MPRAIEQPSASLRQQELVKYPCIQGVVESIYQYLRAISKIRYMTRLATPHFSILPSTVSLQVSIITVNFSFQPIVIEDMPEHETTQISQQNQPVPLVQVPNQHIPFIQPPRTLYDAILFIQSAIIYNWGLIHWSNAVFNKEQHITNISEVTEHELAIIKALKQALINYQKLLDELYFTCTIKGFKGTIPDLQLIKREKDNVIQIIKKMKVEKLVKLLPRTMCFNEDHVICAILGLKFSFADYLSNLDPEIRNHEPLTYWVKYFVSQVTVLDTEDVALRKSFIPDVEILENMQFTNNRAVILKEWIESNDPDHLQNVLYWVCNYIVDIFSSDILLTDAPRYPWSEKEDEWKMESIDMTDRITSNDEQSFSMLSCYDIPYCNIVNKNIENMSYIDNGYFPPKSDYLYTLFFHGTSHEAAVNIINNGINVNIGKGEQDFSNYKGFYVSYDFKEAMNWAKKKSSRPAVIIFKVKKELLNAYNSLNLSDDMDLWQKVIFFNRRGCKREHKKLFNYEKYKKAQYIVGPRCENPKDAKSPNELIGYNEKDSVQLCIVCEELALQFGNLSNIDSVLFF